jgi:hypothetical protein
MQSIALGYQFEANPWVQSFGNQSVASNPGLKAIDCSTGPLQGNRLLQNVDLQQSIA